MKRLFLGLAVLAGLLLPASSATATPFHPTGEFSIFSYCPLTTSNLAFCLRSETTSGSVTTGAKTVPIKNPVILQGGTQQIIEQTHPLLAAATGNTFPPVAQPVPGGLLGIPAPGWWPGWLKEIYENFINEGITGVTATTELAGTPEINMDNLVQQTGTALKLPVKIKLGHPLFGSNCYIGSNSNPVRLNLTTGTTSPPAPNKPISGTLGTLTEGGGGFITHLNGIRLVDNSFAVPGTTGCGGLFSFFVNPFVSSVVGVPSPAGTNTAILEGKSSIAWWEAVKASE